MPRYSTAFGMDVHLRSTTVCALDAETGEAVTRRFRGNPWGEVAEWMSGFPGPSLAAYESGYLGFAPQRELSGLGVDCVVAAVSKVPRSAADLSSKNDRNDAARMAKAILSHDVTPVWVPSPEIEGLQSIKGCGFALAAAFASEVGDFSRFRSGRQVTAYFGLAPKQRSSADSVRLGGISGAGNALVRRLAVEGSWSYVQASHQPKLMPKGSGVPLEVRMHGRKGSERLLRRREGMLARGMAQAKANAATAAELVRWLWALGAMCREATE